ncbi:MAG: hypothetical protein QGD89_08650, partial [Actinomycetota bacterium]|nr:hypothetical protein [Actinomycetota bacterium]
MSNDRELQQVPLIDRVTGTPADFIFEGPSDEDLERIIEHDNGDLTLRGPGGELRLTKATPTWKRHRGYLDDSRIRPVPEVVVRYIYADRSTRELLDLPPRPESKYREQERAYADSPHRLDDPETTCEGYQPWSTLTEDEWNHLEALYDSGPYL